MTAGIAALIVHVPNSKGLVELSGKLCIYVSESHIKAEVEKYRKEQEKIFHEALSMYKEKIKLKIKVADKYNSDGQTSLREYLTFIENLKITGNDEIYINFEVQNLSNERELAIPYLFINESSLELGPRGDTQEGQLITFARDRVVGPYYREYELRNGEAVSDLKAHASWVHIREKDLFNLHIALIEARINYNKATVPATIRVIERDNFSFNETLCEIPMNLSMMLLNSEKESRRMENLKVRFGEQRRKTRLGTIDLDFRGGPRDDKIILNKVNGVRVYDHHNVTERR